MVESVQLKSHRELIISWPIISILVGISFISGSLSILTEDLKYIKYIPLILGAFFIIYGNAKIIISKKNRSFIFPFIILIISSLVRPLQYNSITFISITIFISSIILFLAPVNIRANLKIINGILIIGFLLLLFLARKITFNFSLKSLIFSDTSSLETNISCFLFGFFTIFWFIEKKWKWGIINFILVLLTFKRIVVLGVIISYLFYKQPEKLKLFIRKPTVIIIINLIYVGLSLYIASGQFADFIISHFGVGAGAFTKGRSTFNHLILPYILNHKSVFITGMGQDNLRLLLSSKLGYPQLFHNDIVKLLLEHGIFVFIAFFYFLYKIPFRLLPITIFFNVCMATDNILIYVSVVFCYFLLINNESINRRFKLGSPISN